MEFGRVSAHEFCGMQTHSTLWDVM